MVKASFLTAHAPVGILGLRMSSSRALRELKTWGALFVMHGTLCINGKGFPVLFSISTTKPRVPGISAEYIPRRADQCRNNFWRSRITLQGYYAKMMSRTNGLWCHYIISYISKIRSEHLSTDIILYPECYKIADVVVVKSCGVCRGSESQCI